MTLICFDINIGIKIIQVEKVWGIKWRLNHFSRLRVLTWASVCLSVIAYRLWTCEIWILLKAGSHPWRQAITIHQGLGRRNWKLKLCKSPQRFASLAQTSIMVVFISLHYPLSLREATFWNALVLYGLEKNYFQYTFDLFQITNWRLSQFASKLPWTPWRWCQNQLWRPESGCCRCSWTRPLVLLIHHRRSEKNVVKTLFGVFLTAEGG